MDVQLKVGDVLQVAADVLISTANPWLNLSGGVNGAVHSICPQIQEELHTYLKEAGKSAVPGGTVVQTSARELPFQHVLHAVAIDPFYDSSPELVAETLCTALKMASLLNARTVSMPTLATGYGPLSIKDFAIAMAESKIQEFDLETLFVVVRNEENASVIRGVLDAKQTCSPKIPG